MDRLVICDVKEVEMIFTRGQKCTTTFRLTNLMHTMHVAISLNTTNPSLFSFTHSFFILSPLSTSSFSLFLSQPSDHPPLSSPDHDSITVRSSMLPTGRAHQEDLRRLFSRPGPHVFKDATIPISFVGPDVVEYFLSPQFSLSMSPEIEFKLKKAISGCSGSQLNSLLRLSVVNGKENIVKALIDAGGDVNNRDLNGRSIMSLAIRSGVIEIVKTLISSGCTINDSVDLILHDAAAPNRVDLMEILYVGFEDLDVNLVDSNLRTAIHVAAVQGHVESLKFLVSMGGNTDVSDSNQWTPLHFAAAEGHIEAVEFLLNCCSFTKYAINEDGKTAFALAIDNGHYHLFDLLQLGDVLQRAARVDDVHGMKSCIAEGAKINGRDQNGWTPLHRAAFKGRIESVKLLLNHGAQIDVVDDAGYTPLHCAFEAGHMQVALFLISHGAQANLKSLKGFIPLNLDSFKDHPSLVRPLCCDKERA